MPKRKARTVILLKNNEEPLIVSESYAWLKERLNNFVELRTPEGEVRSVDKKEIEAYAPYKGSPKAKK